MAIEYWVYDDNPTAVEVKQQWVFIEPVDEESESEAKNVIEVWKHDGVDFKQVFGDGPVNPAIVTPGIISHTPLQTTLTGTKTSLISVKHSGHIDGHNPMGQTTSGHGTSYTHKLDWYFPNASSVGDDYYFTITDAPS